MDNKNKDAVALRAIHNDIKTEPGRPSPPRIPLSAGSVFGCVPDAACLLRTAIQPASNPKRAKPIDHTHPCRRRDKTGSMKTGYVSRPSNEPAFDSAYR